MALTPRQRQARRLWMARALGLGGSGIVYDYYVNPDTGNDSNAGTQSAPFETIAAAVAAASSGESIGVLAGSSALEADTLDFDTLTVGVYGGTTKALVDVRYHPTSPSWSLVSGTSNTYEATITHREAVVPGGIAETGWHFGCWLDLTSLTWVAGGADIAANTTTVDGQAGSFTVYKSGSTVQDPRLDTAGTDYVYRVHLPDGTSPAGKDVSVADRPAVFLAQNSSFSDLEFIGAGGKDMSGDNNLGTRNTFANVLFRDAPVHTWVGSPVTATNWGATRRVSPGISGASAGRAGNLINLYDGDNSDKALDTSLTFRNVGNGWRKLVYAHTAGGQTDRIGNNLTIDFQNETIDNIENVVSCVNSTNKLFAQIDVSNFTVTNGDGSAFAAGTVLNARNFDWSSANPKTTNVQIIDVYDDTLIEDAEWEFMEAFNVSRRNWLYAAIVTGKTLTIRRCTDRAWNTTRRAYMRRGGTFENAHLVIEDSTLGNLMDQAAGVNWPASVTASNSTLGFGDRTQAQVEAAMTTAGVSYSFTNCTFVDTNGNITSTP